MHMKLQLVGSRHFSNMDKIRLNIRKYIENIEKIGVLSSPKFSFDRKIQDYIAKLRENFVEIGRLAAENREILDHYLFPVLQREKLSDTDRILLKEAFDALVNGYTMENVDIPIATMIADKLLDDALVEGDDEALIRALDDNVLANYNLMNMSKRTQGYATVCERARENGFRAARLLLTYVQPDKFLTLQEDDSREAVLTNARYISSLYENMCGDYETNRENIEILQNAFQLAENPFYREHSPEFDWNYYQLRTCEYFGMVLEQDNSRGFDQLQCREVQKKCALLKKLWEKNPTENEKIITLAEVQLLSARAEYLSGILSKEEYKQILSGLYRQRNTDRFTINDVFINVLLPIEYIHLFDDCSISEKDKSIVEEIYHNATNYAFRLPDQLSFNFLLEYFCELLACFIEIPGGMTFQELGLNCLAAFHPPTYVHSMMVGKLTVCLCTQLLQSHPEAFRGIMGYDGRTPMTENQKYDILSFAYQSGLCHDFGKLYVMDVISVYGRKILENEFAIIKSHPRLGGMLLSRCESTRRYANIAKGHHKWYDNTKGYPEDFDTGKVPEKVIIDLVAVADCIDAATDTVGRSYNRGKTLDDMKAELTEGAGTRYTPYIVELLEDEKVCRDITYILTQYRERLYRNTYMRLQQVTEWESHDSKVKKCSDRIRQLS